MSCKIDIPSISKDYRGALIDYLLKKGAKKEDFYKHLNVISGYCQDVDASTAFGGGLGGCKTVDQLITSATDPFRKATYTEFLRFHKQGYSSGDFQHIFMDAYLCIMVDIICAQEDDHDKP